MIKYEFIYKKSYSNKHKLDKLHQNVLLNVTYFFTSPFKLFVFFKLKKKLFIVTLPEKQMYNFI